LERIGVAIVLVQDWLPFAVRSAAIDRRLKAGESLFRVGDKTFGICEVISGRIRLVRIDRTGREAVLHSAGPGELVAEASLFSAHYHCDAIASTNAVVRVYPKNQLMRALRQEPQTFQAFMAALAHQVMDLRTRIEQRNIRSAPERVRHFLALNAAQGRTVQIQGTLKELAAELGLTHETLYRTLAQLERSGRIKRTGTKILILEPTSKGTKI
jgi:CRP-like cAMP-binding protein